MPARISLGSGPVGSTDPGCPIRIRQTTPGRHWARAPRFQLPCPTFCSRVREGHPLASRLISKPPSLACKAGANGWGQAPRLGLCPQGEGIQVAQPLQGLVGWGGWGVGQAVGASQQPACGQLGHATGRRAGSGQAAGTPGRAGGIRGSGGQETDKTDGSQDLGPSCPEEALQRQAGQGPGTEQ